MLDQLIIDLEWYSMKDVFKCSNIFSNINSVNDTK